MRKPKAPRRCILCGADLRRRRNVRAALRWQEENAERYRRYHREYARKLRARKREAANSGRLLPP
jgi:hypothetical protein